MALRNIPEVPGYLTPTIGSTSVASGATVTEITGLSLSGPTVTGTLTAGSAVGTNGQVLQSTGTGVQWAAAGGSADQNFVLLNPSATTFTGGSTKTVSFTSYNSLRIYFYANMGYESILSIRLNGDSTSQYGQVGMTRVNNFPNGEFVAPGAATSITAFETGATGTSLVMAKINIDGAKTSGVKDMNILVTGSASTWRNALIGGATYSGTSPITSISFSTSADTYSSGQIYIYGG